MEELCRESLSHTPTVHWSSDPLQSGFESLYLQPSQLLVPDGENLVIGDSKMVYLCFQIKFFFF